jgi:hypothetical protein
MKNVFMILLVLGVFTLSDQEPISDTIMFFPMTDETDNNSNLNLSDLAEKILEKENIQQDEDVEDEIFKRNYFRDNVN